MWSVLVSCRHLQPILLCWWICCFFIISIRGQWFLFSPLERNAGADLLKNENKHGWRRPPRALWPWSVRHHHQRAKDEFLVGIGMCKMKGGRGCTDWRWRDSLEYYYGGDMEARVMSERSRSCAHNTNIGAGCGGYIDAANSTSQSPARSAPVWLDCMSVQWDCSSRQEEMNARGPESPFTLTRWCLI